MLIIDCVSEAFTTSTAVHVLSHAGQAEAAARPSASAVERHSCLDCNHAVHVPASSTVGDFLACSSIACCSTWFGHFTLVCTTVPLWLLCHPSGAACLLFTLLIHAAWSRSNLAFTINGSCYKATAADCSAYALHMAIQMFTLRLFPDVKLQEP